MAVTILGICWLVFAVGAFLFYARAERERRSHPPSSGGAVLRSSASLYGMVLETLAFVFVWLFRRPSVGHEPLLAIVCGVLLAPASVAFFLWALIHLGREFRVQAVVGPGHQLVATGPYAVVRHPIYLSMLGLLVSNAMVVSRWEAALVGLVVYIAGTEIRVRTEDGLLARRFGETFDRYRSRVPAYVPYFR
jgi:protein-S-isoprenylcysteine O-methyltransferase Ste14